MKKIKVGINGFGRIGRAVCKILTDEKNIELVHINDINPRPDNLIYLLKYDSTYGKFNKKAEIKNNKIKINNFTPKFSAHKNIDEVPWDKSNVDYIIESTGIENNVIRSKKLFENSKVKKVIVTKCSKNSDKEIIMGFNESKITKKDKIISASICDANAAAHILNWIDKEYKIINGSLTTLHPWLTYQNLVDGTALSQSKPGVVWNDFALGRSSVRSLIPKNTSAMDAVETVLPNLKNKIMSFSYRTPTDIVATLDLTLNLKTKPTHKTLVSFLKKKCNQSKYLTYNLESKVSLDYAKDTMSANIDLQWIKVNSNTVKIIAWYDNEWGFSSRIVDIIKSI